MWQKIYDDNFSLDRVIGRIKKYGLEINIDVINIISTSVFSGNLRVISGCIFGTFDL